MIPHKWRSSSPNEFGKRVIHERPHTYNNNGSWILDTTLDSSRTPEDAAATTAITMSIIGQKTAGAALVAASAAAKAIMLQNTIGDDKSTNGTATTEITQNQANEIYRIQANLSNHATTIEGMSSYLSKFGTQK